MEDGVFPLLTETSTFAQLTSFLAHSLHNTHIPIVDKILANREKGFLDELHRMRTDRDNLVVQRYTVEKNLELELEKARLYETILKRERDMFKKELSLVSISKNKVENELIEHQRERDVMEKELSVASVEKLKVENELREHQRELEAEIQILKRENSELKKEIQVYKENFSKRIELAEKEVNQLKGVIGAEMEGFSDPNAMDYSSKSKSPNSHEKVDNLEFRQRNIHPENCLNDCEVLGNAQVEGKCSEERTTGVQLGESERGKETRWKTKVDMLTTLGKDPELCMSAVCALYRRHISAVKSTDNIGFRLFDIESGIATAKYLINNDPTNKLSRSVSEVQQDSPSTLETCWELTAKYLAQLFEMYQKKLDPFFCPES